MLLLLNAQAIPQLHSKEKYLDIHIYTAVYITEKTAMIDVKAANNGKISLRALKTVKELGYEDCYGHAGALIRGGASEVAVMNGRSGYALTAYLCGGRCDGLLISAV